MKIRHALLSMGVGAPAVGVALAMISEPEVFREHSVSNLIIGYALAVAAGCILALPLAFVFHIASTALYDSLSRRASGVSILMAGAFAGTLYLTVPAFFGMRLYILKFAGPIIGLGCAAYCLIREMKNENSA